MDGPWAKVLLPVNLTGSGRPQFEQGEVECHLLDGADLEHEAEGWALKSGLLTLTTHRVLWLNDKERKAWAVPLASLGQVYTSRKGLKSMFSAPKMRFQVWTQGDGQVAAQGPQKAQGSFVLTIVFKGKSVPEPFVQQFWEVVQAQAWKVRMCF